MPYRAVGDMRMFAAHDRLVARRLRKLRGQVDVVHAWPLGALETLRTAKALGIPTALERPNAHTRFAYEVVRAECERIGVPLPPDHEHAYNENVLRKEEAEYELADALACPSDFVVQTFLDQGLPREQLVPPHLRLRRAPVPSAGRVSERAADPFTALFVGVAAVRKGLHFALEAWLRRRPAKRGACLSPARFSRRTSRSLSRCCPTRACTVLGHRKDVPDLMRSSDVFVLPSLEEGSALACSEALGCGCAALVSDATSGVCKDGVDSLVHQAGDVAALTEHITTIFRDRTLLKRLRQGALTRSQTFTWEAAGSRLADAYEEVVAR